MLVAAAGATGLGAAFLPDGPLCSPAGPRCSPAGSLELRLSSEAEPHLRPEAPDLRSVTAAPSSWGQPLAFRCYDSGGGMICCALDPP